VAIVDYVGDPIKPCPLCGATSVFGCTRTCPNQQQPGTCPDCSTFTIPVGNTHQPSVAHDSVRTPAQALAVRRIVAQPGFSFACGNPLTLDHPGEPYSCTFNFLWYGTDGVLQVSRITPTGRTKTHAVVL
jgi:hypothetical protein